MHEKTTKGRDENSFSSDEDDMELAIQMSKED